MNHFSIQLKQHLERLNQNRARRDRVTAYKVALEVGLDPTYVTNIFHGRKRGSSDTLRKISQSQLLALSYETLRGWQARDTYEPEAIREAYRETHSATAEALPPNSFVRVPCVGSVSAGTLSLSKPAEDVVYYEWWDLNTITPADRDQLLCLKVEGDSMWPPVPSGSLLLVKKVANVQELRSGRWYVVNNAFGDASFKMVELDSTGGRLVPLNLQYQPIKLEDVHMDQAFEVLKYQVSLV
jgi:SOS-response transcriptional repressor LexA